MTALNFPSNPSGGQLYENYIYDSTDQVWKRVPPVVEPTVINTDGDPGTKIYVGAIDPDVSYTLQAGDIWIEVPA